MNTAPWMIFLVAPNTSEQMGGEAIKALQIFQEFKKINQDTFQITHERCKGELSGRLKLGDVYYVQDNLLAKFLWRSVILRHFLDYWFTVKAVRLAEKVAALKVGADQFPVIHQTEPNSPVVLRRLSKLCLNVIGPVNGNIYYPKTFRTNESLSLALRRVFHMPIQRLSAILCRRSKRADLVLAAGGERTTASLIAAGYRPSIIINTVDCGVPDRLLDQPRASHQGSNFRFVHYGRLVFHKGTFLAIESLKLTSSPISLDIIGRGPELKSLEILVDNLHLGDRVRFLEWKQSHRDLMESIREYRGVVLPSLEDANGIVVQEALAIGLPPICLNWGGPQLLIEHGKTGVLIDPTTREDITLKIAETCDMLANQPQVAEQMSKAGRARAEAWRWSKVANEWISRYPRSRELF